MAHLRHARAERGTGGVTEELIVDQGRYGGSAGVDGGAPVATMDKMVTQQDTKHHGNTEKMELCFARAETHRRVLATVKRARWHCGHPRGRRAMRSVSR